jgi:hypothetical protein
VDRGALVTGQRPGGVFALHARQVRAYNAALSFDVVGEHRRITDKRTLHMSTGLTEDDMRRALGLDVATPTTPAAPEPVAAPIPEPIARAAPAPVEVKTPPAPRPKTKRLSPALVVTLRVTREFEGEETLYVHEAKTLSTFDAEQEARKAASKEKYKYFEVVSIKRVE